jgi:hypothetical protein
MFTGKISLSRGAGQMAIDPLQSVIPVPSEARYGSRHSLTQNSGTQWHTGKVSEVCDLARVASESLEAPAFAPLWDHRTSIGNMRLEFKFCFSHSHMLLNNRDAF